ncbi:hypothetical protein ACFPRL_32280 [Pseudoclavibacter helvolus]
MGRRRRRDSCGGRGRGRRARGRRRGRLLRGLNSTVGQLTIEGRVRDWRSGRRTRHSRCERRNQEGKAEHKNREYLLRCGPHPGFLSSCWKGSRTKLGGNAGAEDRADGTLVSMRSPNQK